MEQYNVFIKPGKEYSNPIEYTLKLLGKNQNIQFNFTGLSNNASLIFDDTNPSHSIPIATDFYHKLLNKKSYSFQYHFNQRSIIQNSEGTEDFLATAFYMVNCFQEYDADEKFYDKYGRFLYERSYQHHYNNIEENLVQKIFDSFCKLYLQGHKPKITKSQIFVSHDIDTIHGALLQDGYWALKHSRPDILLKLVFNAFLLKPDWKNMDRIMNINDEYGIKSTFFWIINNSKSDDGVKNADYKINSLKPLLNRIEKQGFFNGLHKSFSDLSFSEEINRFPGEVKYNRNHFIHYTLPNLWHDLENTGLKADFSLGFAQRHGFRNSYGFPFSPYNVEKGKAFALIEVPLNIMDTTFHKYLKKPVNETTNSIINFIEKNAHNAILSLLWHNIYFTDLKYNGYLKEYKKLLGYFYEVKMQHITPPEIIKEFSYGE